MPSGQSTFNTTIHLGAEVDPNLVKAMGTTNSELMKIQALIASLNKTTGVLNKQFNGLSPSIQKATREATGFHGSLKRVGELAAGITIGEGLISGLRMAGDLVRNLTDGFIQFAKTSSEVSAQWELMKRGLGNILGNQPLANTIFEQEFKTAVRSPFQAKDLMNTVKRLVAAGSNVGTAQSMTKQIGDLVAGVGGGQPEMERAALVFGKIQSSGFMSGQEGRELKDLGIPYAATLKKILGTDDLEKAQKKHMITEAVVQKMLDEMTGPHGMFFNSMEKFAETFRGVQTSVADVVQRFESQFGDIENLWTKYFMQGFGGPDIWDRVTGFMDNLAEANKSVFRFVTSIPSKELLSGIQPALDLLSNQFHYIFGKEGLGQFFDYNVGGTQGSFYEQSGYHLNTAGMNQVKDYLKDLGTIVDKVGEIVNKISLIGNAISPAISVISKLATFFNSIDDILYGKLFTSFMGGFGKAGDLLNSFGKTLGIGGYHTPKSASPESFSTPGYAIPENKLASGGVLIGEAGIEAVLPMSNSHVLDDLNDTLGKLNDILSFGSPMGGGGGFSGGWRLGGGLGGAAGNYGYTYGGVKITGYGPAIDPPGSRYYDSNSYHGIGDRNNQLVDGLSVALTRSERQSLFGTSGSSTGKTFRFNGKLYRDDDTAPESDRRIDEYHSKPVNVTVNYHVHAIEAGDVHRFAKQHAKTLHKHIQEQINWHKEAKFVA